MENNFDVEIIERDPRTFHFHPANPRDHSDEAVATLAESIQEDPLYFRGRPVLLSDRTGELVVIGGEGRTRAALLLGLDTVPSVVFHGLDEESEVRIMQKDNAHTGKWNDAKLSELAKMWGGAKIKQWSPGVKWENLPRELASVNLAESGGGLPEIPVEDVGVLPYKKIVLCYRHEDEAALAKALGLNVIARVVYRFEELFQ